MQSKPWLVLEILAWKTYSSGTTGTMLDYYRKAYKAFCRKIVSGRDELDELGEGDLCEAAFGAGSSMKP